MRELDVPHWALQSIANFRKRIECPNWLSDSTIYAAMLTIDNDEAKRAEILRDLAIITYIIQQQEANGNAPRK